MVDKPVIRVEDQEVCCSRQWLDECHASPERDWRHSLTLSSGSRHHGQILLLITAPEKL